MRLLLDSCVWPPTAGQLRAAGHDVQSVADWSGDPGDDAILKRSTADNRVLVTLDKDFGELVFVMGREHAGILRLVNIPARQQGRTIITVLEKHREDLQNRALIVAESGRLRVRLPS